ncbi:MAG: hypothetical protein ABEI74_01850 [Candidatus Pacearchaeota archaeon]
MKNLTSHLKTIGGIALLAGAAAFSGCEKPDYGSPKKDEKLSKEEIKERKEEIAEKIGGSSYASYAFDTCRFQEDSRITFGENAKSATIADFYTNRRGV